MAKKKNVKRSGMSDAVLGKKSSASKVQKTNPFEVHVNKQKFAVMNRDSKNDRGLPGVSRAKAAKRRQETLGTEMDTMHKTNRFKDKRLGGGRFKSGEDLATAKFAKEMMSRLESSKSSKRKSLFNLNDGFEGGNGDGDEEEEQMKQLLTHKGQTLKEIEQFQEAVSDGDDDPEDSEMLNAEFTDTAHFGGGAPDGDDRRSRKDMIDELINETRRRKAEAAKEKDQIQSMTEKLDEAWRSLIPVMGKFQRHDEERAKPDAYDRTMREMIFEARGEPTDKLKSKEELAKQEREKLERLEMERLRRMRDEEAGENRPKHRSADDLDDQFYPEEEEDEDGQQPQVWGQNPEVPEADKGEEEEADGDMGEEEEDGDEDEEDSESEEEEEDDFKDLKSSDDEEEQEKVKPKKKAPSLNAKEIEAVESATLPFTFELPNTYEELQSLLHPRSPSEQATILERIIKCNHPGLEAGNKEKLVSLAAFLCQYFNDLFDVNDLSAENAKKAFEIFAKLRPFMIKLAEHNSLAIGNLLREVLSEKMDDLKKTKKYPNLDTFMFLQLVNNLFSTSDFKHGVATPAFVCISQILTRCSVESCRDVARGLFLSTISLEATAQSKRFLPAVIVFLDGVFRSALPNRTVDSRLPFQFKNAPELALQSKKKGTPKKTTPTEIRMNASDLVCNGNKEVVAEDFKIRSINSAALLAIKFFEQMQENVGAIFYAQALGRVLSQLLTVVGYPESVKETLKSLDALLQKIQARKLTPLRLRDQPVKQLRMLEPKFEQETYHDRRVKSKPTGKSLQEAMRHKVKREMKGAIRDIKLDNAFMAKQKLSKQRILDRERKEKVKRIFAEASVQQGELNAMDRQNSKRKK